MNRSCYFCISPTHLHAVYSFDVVLTELPVLCPDMSTQGALWFSNLLIPDTTLVLPVSVCLLNLIIIQVSFCIWFQDCTL